MQKAGLNKPSAAAPVAKPAQAAQPVAKVGA
jgi:hypothetical protein